MLLLDRINSDIKVHLHNWKLDPKRSLIMTQMTIEVHQVWQFLFGGGENFEDGTGKIP